MRYVSSYLLPVSECSVTCVAVTVDVKVTLDDVKVTLDDVKVTLDDVKVTVDDVMRIVDNEVIFVGLMSVSWIGAVYGTNFVGSETENRKIMVVYILNWCSVLNAIVQLRLSYKGDIFF